MSLVTLQISSPSYTHPSWLRWKPLWLLGLSFSLVSGGTAFSWVREPKAWSQIAYKDPSSSCPRRPSGPKALGWPSALLAAQSPYIDSLSIDVSADGGGRGRGVGHSVRACLTDVNLRGRDFQSSAGHLGKETTSPSQGGVSMGLGCLLPPGHIQGYC